MSDLVQGAVASGVLTLLAGVVALWLKRCFDLADRRKDDGERGRICEEAYLRLLSHHRHGMQRLKIAVSNRASNASLFELVIAELNAEAEWPNELRAPARREEDRSD